MALLPANFRRSGVVLLPKLKAKNLTHVTRCCPAVVPFPTFVLCALGFVIVCAVKKAQREVAESQVFLAGLTSVLTFSHVTR